MKILMFAALALSSNVFAQEIQCPEFYPEKEIKLSEVPAGHKGSGLLRGGDLSEAFIYVGELHSDPAMQQTMLPVPTKVKGGWDMVDNFTPNDTKRWLVCVYGGDRESADRPRTHGRTEWWEQIDRKFSSCVLRFREIKRPNQAPSSWSATAVCR